MLVKFNLKLLPTISYLKGYSYPKLYCKKLSNQKPTGTLGNRVQLQNDIENCSMSCVFLRSPSSKRPYFVPCDDLLQQVHWLSSPVNRRDEIAFNRHLSRLHIRDLTIRQQPRPWKRRWKIDFTSFHFFRDYSKGPSNCLKEGILGWSWREGPRPSSGVNIQGLQRNAQNSVMHVQSCWARSIQPKSQPARPGKVVHLIRWTRFFETFPVGPNRSIEFWTKISGNFDWMDRARCFAH